MRGCCAGCSNAGAELDSPDDELVAGASEDDCWLALSPWRGFEVRWSLLLATVDEAVDETGTAGASTGVTVTAGAPPPADEGGDGEDDNVADAAVAPVAAAAVTGDGDCAESRVAFDKGEVSVALIARFMASIVELNDDGVGGSSAEMRISVWPSATPVDERCTPAPKDANSMAVVERGGAISALSRIAGDDEADSFCRRAAAAKASAYNRLRHNLS